MTQPSSPEYPHSSPDIRRMTSNSTLLTPSHREHKVSTHPSQHLQTGSARLGSRSPSSIPSSPTSAHSSSSAIFERDIEPLGPPSPPTHAHPPNPHRIPRSKTTEQLDQSVPSVLDTAAAILTSASCMEEDHIAVVTPACERPVRPSSGIASPIGSLRSRSPSPTGTTGIRTLSSAAPRASLLLSVPSSPSAQPQPQPQPLPILNPSASPKDINQTQRLSIQTHPSALSPSMSPPRDGGAHTRTSPSINTPTSVYYSTVSSNDGSPTTTTLEHPRAPIPTQTQPQSQISSHTHTYSPPAPASILSANPAHILSPSSQCSAAAPHTAVTSTGSPYTFPTTLSHPPSPTPNQKRLSFISYTDLLASTPAATVPLSSFTNCSAADPPPHIPRVSGMTTHYGGSRGRERGGDHRDGDRERTVSGGDRDSVMLFDDLGGEWAREGLGKGLEERLEALMAVP